MDLSITGLIIAGVLFMGVMGLATWAGAHCMDKIHEIIEKREERKKR